MGVRDSEGICESFQKLESSEEQEKSIHRIRKVISKRRYKEYEKSSNVIEGVAGLLHHR
ncbi:hypothetical protein OROMI_006981 [Orobanche minor]